MRKVLEYCKQSIMVHFSDAWGNKDAERYANRRGPTHIFFSVSETNVSSISNWTRGFSCCILQRDIASFCSSSNKLSETELKVNELISSKRLYSKSGFGMADIQVSHSEE